MIHIIMNDPFTATLVIFPIITFILSFIGQLLIRKKIVILCIVFIAYLIATFTLFNSSFLIWCFVYTFIALIGTFIGDFILKYKK